MTDNVVYLKSFKEKKAADIITFIMTCDEFQFIEYLAQSHIEFQKQEKPELSDILMEQCIKLRSERIRKCVKHRIEALK